jgi:hypothetical protein
LRGAQLILCASCFIYEWIELRLCASSSISPPASSLILLRPPRVPTIQPPHPCQPALPGQCTELKGQ